MRLISTILAAILVLALPAFSRAAVLEVTKFGATIDDGTNDLLGIQAAINASKPGDTILFSSGVFDLTGTSGDALTLLPDRTYKGTSGATLRGRGANGQLLSVRVDNVKFAGLTFDGDYYVKSVSHNLRIGSYQQNFTIAREGLIARTPIVRP